MTSSTSIRNGLLCAPTTELHPSHQCSNPAGKCFCKTPQKRSSSAESCALLRYRLTNSSTYWRRRAAREMAAKSLQTQTQTLRAKNEPACQDQLPFGSCLTGRTVPPGSVIDNSASSETITEQCYLQGKQSWHPLSPLRAKALQRRDSSSGTHETRTSDTVI